MTRETQSNVSFAQLIEQWHGEHRDLNQFLDEVRDWTYEVTQLGYPRFGEAGEKLSCLRERLITHFQRESDLGIQLVNHDAAPTLETEKACRQAAHDHHNLTTRLDDLIHRLNQVNPPFDSWQQAVDELELFVDALEQHEEQESESMQWLAPDVDQSDTEGPNRQLPTDEERP